MDRKDNADAARDIVVMVLAGGEGQRLYPLTRRRAKPAVRYGGDYRMIDFTLSNCVNSGYRRIYLLTQFAASSLHRHVRRGWVPLLSDELGEFIEMVPAQRMAEDRWYAGTADAIYQNLFILQEERPSLVIILSGDHAYKMDYRGMVRQHLETGAALTIASLKAPRTQCTQLGVLEVDRDWRVAGFEEKPVDPRGVPDDPDHSLVSMGVYVWTTAELVRRVADDSTRDTNHDFGKDLIPTMVSEGSGVWAYHFDRDPSGSPSYWRDIGTLDAYWQANMELVGILPELNLYDREWPVYSHKVQLPPAKTVHGSLCSVTDSLISPGCVISGARIHSSVLSPGVYVHRGAEISESIIMDDCEVGRDAVLHRTVVDEGVKVPEGFRAGFDRAEDERRFLVTEGGVTVIPQGMVLHK